MTSRPHQLPIKECKGASKSHTMMPLPSSTFSSAEDADPDYINFLSHLVPNGKSYILSMPPPQPITIKYEPPIIHTHDDEEEEKGFSSDVIKPNSQNPNRKGEVEMEVDEEWLQRIEDEDFRNWIRHSRVVNDRVVLEIDGVVVKYEVSEEKEEEEEVDEESRREKGKKKSEFQWVEEVKEEKEVVNDKKKKKKKKKKKLNNRAYAIKEYESEASEFKSGLLRELEKPFNRDEYDKLLKWATERKPQIKTKELRSKSIWVPTGQMSSSYFDRHPDLAEQVENAGYDRGLSLLRGFFFWLQCKTREGSYQPWVVASKDYRVVPLKSDKSK